MKTASWALAASKCPLLYSLPGEKAPPGSSTVLTADVVRLPRPPPQQVPEASTHFWFIWFDWSRLVGSISEFWGNEAVGLSKPKATSWAGISDGLGLSCLWQPMTYPSATRCLCKKPLNQSLGVWQIILTVGKKDETGGYKQLAEVIVPGRRREGLCQPQGPSSQPGLPGADLREHVGVAALSSSSAQGLSRASKKSRGEGLRL